MKRELLHPDCVLPDKGFTQNTDNFDLAQRQATGEGVRRVRGRLLNVYLCDGCGGLMDRGDRAVAQSIYSDRAPWIEWEGSYITQPTQCSEGQGVT